MEAPHKRSSSSLVVPHDAVRISTATGSIAYWQPAPSLYATEVQGHMTAPMARLIIEHAEPLYARTRSVTGFHNWLSMTNYDSACRVELTAWVLRHRAASTLHIGLRSRMVAMGVTVANLALGNLIQVHADLYSLDAALGRALSAR